MNMDQGAGRKRRLQVMGLYSTDRCGGALQAGLCQVWGGFLRAGSLAKTEGTKNGLDSSAKPKPKVKATQSTILILALIRFIVPSHPHSPLPRLASPYLVLTFE